MNGKFKPVPCGETRLAVLSVVLCRWFDKSMRVRSPTFREAMNDLRKFYGMKVTPRQIANIVRELEGKEIVERSRSTERGLGRATVVTLKPNRILQCLFNGVKLDREGESAFFRQDSAFNEWYEGF